MSLDPNKKLTLPPKCPSAAPRRCSTAPAGRRSLIVTGYGECEERKAGERERKSGETSGGYVGWMEAGMRVSVYEGWRSELWGTWWCPGWQPRWHYLRVCRRSKAEENRMERKGKKERDGETKRAKERSTKRDPDGKRGGASEKDSQVERRGSLQKDTRGQRGIRPDRTSDSGSNEQRKRLIPTCYLEETTARSSSIVFG